MDIQKIKKLREETGLGMLEVKQALEDAHHDLERAKELLNQHQRTKETSTRVASKGLTRVVTQGDDAILFEVNGETDFLAKHPLFLDMMDRLGHHLINTSAITLNDAKKSHMDGITVEAMIEKVAQVVKENCFLRRFHHIKKQPQQFFYSYMHQGGKLSVLLILDQDSPDIGKKLAMHIASHAPKYLSFDHLDQQTIDYERFLLSQENVAHADQDMNQAIKAMCLLDQPSLFDPNIRVSTMLNGVNVIDFYRFELGQGIDHKLNCRLDIPCDGSTMTVTPIF